MKLGILVHPFYMGMGSYKMNKHRLITYLSTIDKYDKVYVYMPTWRDDGRDFIRESHINFEVLNKVLKQKNYYLIMVN